MPNRPLTEAEIAQIAQKYIHNVHRDVTKIPDIRKIVNEAIKNVAPKRNLSEADAASVLSRLQKSPTISDKIIQEAAKQVVDHSALEDLKYMVRRNVQGLGKKASPKDIESIIEKGKLDPYSSSLAQIRQSVQSYYTSGERPVENIEQGELEKMVKTEIGGNVDDRTVKDVAGQVRAKVDPEKPFDADEVRDIIKQNASTPPPEGPQPSPVQTATGAKPPSQPPKGPKQGSWVPPDDPKNPTFFEKIRLKLKRYGIKSLTRGARNWLTDNVNRVSRAPSRKKLITEGETTAQALVGKMFLYFYDAKTKRELPYWDKFPLIFVTDLYKDGWLGLNLHYLPLLLRIKLFDRLLTLADNRTLDKITKLRLSYAVIKNFSEYPEVKPCIKRYLSSHIKSDLLHIEAVDWEVAIFLPVEQFQKETKENVWKDSRKKIHQTRH